MLLRSSLVAFAGALEVMASPKVAIKARVLVDLKELGSYGKMLDPTCGVVSPPV